MMSPTFPEIQVPEHLTVKSITASSASLRWLVSPVAKYLHWKMAVKANPPLKVLQQVRKKDQTSVQLEWWSLTVCFTVILRLNLNIFRDSSHRESDCELHHGIICKPQLAGVSWDGADSSQLPGLLPEWRDWAKVHLYWVLQRSHHRPGTRNWVHY